MISFADLCEVVTATTGTGTITLGAAVAGYSSKSVLTSGATYNYSIRDSANAFEVGTGVYNGTTLTRATIKASSNAGSALNLSGNAIVAIGQPLAADLPAAWPFLDVSYGSGGGSYHVGTNGFNTVPLTDINVDTHSGMNASTFIYTIPQNGIYRVDAGYRLQDIYSNAVSTGIGIDITNQDSPQFYWGVTNPNRNGIKNNRTTYFTSGSQLRLFCYIDGGGDPIITASSMQVLRVK